MSRKREHSEDSPTLPGSAKKRARTAESDHASAGFSSFETDQEHNVDDQLPEVEHHEATHEDDGGEDDEGEDDPQSKSRYDSDHEPEDENETEPEEESEGDAEDEAEDDDEDGSLAGSSLSISFSQQPVWSILNVIENIGRVSVRDFECIHLTPDDEGCPVEIAAESLRRAKRSIEAARALDDILMPLVKSAGVQERTEKISEVQRLLRLAARDLHCETHAQVQLAGDNYALIGQMWFADLSLSPQPKEGMTLWCSHEVSRKSLEDDDCCGICLGDLRDEPGDWDDSEEDPQDESDDDGYAELTEETEDQADSCPSVQATAIAVLPASNDAGSNARSLNTSASRDTVQEDRDDADDIEVGPQDELDDDEAEETPSELNRASTVVVAAESAAGSNTRGRNASVGENTLQDDEGDRGHIEQDPQGESDDNEYVELIDATDDEAVETFREEVGAGPLVPANSIAATTARSRNRDSGENTLSAEGQSESPAHEGASAYDDEDEEEEESKLTGLTWCRNGCWRNVHAACWQRWSSSPRYGGKCLYCQKAWYCWRCIECDG